MAQDRSLTLALALVLALVAAGCEPGEEPPPAVSPTLPPLEFLEPTGAEIEGTNEGSPLRIDPDPFDGGLVRDDVVLYVDFRMTNPGDAPLRVLKLKPECACVVTRPRFKGAEVSLPFALPPGGTLVVPVRIDPGGRQGEFDTHVRVTVDHEQMPYAWLQMRMRVEPEVEVTPLFCFLGEVAPDEAAKGVVTLSGRDPRLTATRLVTSSPLLRARVLSHLPGARYWRTEVRIGVELSADAPAGEHELLLGVETNHPRAPSNEVTVKVIKRGAGVEALPATVDFGEIAQSARPVRVLQLRGPKGTLQVERFSAEPTWLKVSQLKAAADGSAQLQVAIGEVPEEARAGAVRGTIRVEVEGFPPKLVPVRLRFAGE